MGRPRIERRQVYLPDKIAQVFAPPRGSLRNRGIHGGRGSGKSFGAAKVSLLWAQQEKLRVLATREFQSSIRESFHAELRRAIESDSALAGAYDVGVDYIRGRNGSEFFFRGLHANIETIRSMSAIDLVIIEEAEDVSEESWRALEPTIRAPRSEIWAIWNPRKKGSPVDRRFRLAPAPRTLTAEVNWHDNPWFPAVLEEQRRHAQRVMDDATYAHVWDGAYLENSVAQILAGKYVIEEFERGKLWSGPYQGLDFGFSQDPTAGVRAWIDGNVLYVEHEAGGVGVELDHTAPLLIRRVPGFEKHKTRADSARPESISYLRRHGLPLIETCAKGKGSVNDGIAFLRSFDRIVIHPRCREVISEARLYSWAVDRRSGEVLDVPVDANNHYIDALRYALEPAQKNSSPDWGRLL